MGIEEENITASEPSGRWTSVVAEKGRARKILRLLNVWAVPAVVAGILLTAMFRRVPVFETFMEGVRSGARSCVGIFPSLLGLIPAVAMLRASGALEGLAQILMPVTAKIGLPAELVPLVLLRPVSGGGSIALLQELLAQVGPDSFAGRVASVLAGATETTFYTITVYFGAVHIRRTRHTLPAALLADMACVLLSLLTVRWLFS
jgi:spore maturation protein B